MEAGVDRKPSRWQGIAQVGLAGTTAVLTVVLCDLALGMLAPPVRLREVDDALDEMRETRPTVLVVGSSHARSFVPVARELEDLSGGRQRMLAVPVEWGKWTSYEWVIRHRIWPELDRQGPAESDPDGPRWMLLVTEWWDSTALDPGTGRIDMNLPARSWTWAHFLRDLARNGLTPYNQNFLQKVWREWWRGSALVQDRGFQRIPEAVKERIRGPETARKEASRQRRLAGWRTMVEEGEAALFDPGQEAAFDRIVEEVRSRGIRLGVILYPRMPGTLTDRARQGTLRVFARRMEERCRRMGIPFWDHTTDAPLTDEDFAEDFDHILPEGNRRLAHFLLQGSLRWLWDPATPVPQQEAP
ncbi:hypothetical protein KBD49_14305 [Myxococcota bacterium]|jgi:hypothetical protein|nr:hypothetical protein [Myxococcota bacterium]